MHCALHKYKKNDHLAIKKNMQVRFAQAQLILLFSSTIDIFLKGE